MLIPGIPDLTNLEDQLKQYKIKNSYSNAQTAAQLAAWGWGTSTWSEIHVTALMNGTAKLTDMECEFVTQFLLAKYYAYNTS